MRLKPNSTRGLRITFARCSERYRHSSEAEENILMSEGKMSLTGRVIIVLLIVGCAYGAWYFLVRKGPDADGKDPGSAATPAKGSAVEIGIAYGTEKKTWIEWAAQEFAKTPE